MGTQGMASFDEGDTTDGSRLDIRVISKSLCLASYGAAGLTVEQRLMGLWLLLLDRTGTVDNTVTLVNVAINGYCLLLDRLPPTAFNHL